MKFNGPESIKIKRVPKAGYFGISSYPKSVTTIGCEMSAKGTWKTGLTDEEQKFYEHELGLKPGELSKHSKWWDKVFNVEHAIRLNNNKATELILEDTINQLRYKVILEHSKIANSEIQKTPNSLFYIDDAEAKAKAELETFSYEYEASAIIHRLSPDEKRQALRLFGVKGVDSVTETVVNAKLYENLKKDPKKFVETLNDKNVKTKALIEELIDKHIIIRKGNYFMHGEDTIAASTEECVAYLNDPKNQSVRMILESRLNKTSKKK